MYSIVVAHDSERGIGINNQLPWKLKKDMSFFKSLTTSNSPGKVETDFGLAQKDVANSIGSPAENAVIMGRNTWDSIPEKFKPLSHRLNIILSRNSEYSADGAFALVSMQDALNLAKEKECPFIYVIGGASLYSQCVKDESCNKLYITEIQKKFSCDVFFPEIHNSFENTFTSPEFEEGDINFHFKIWERKI